MSRRVRVFSRLVDRVLGVPVATMTAADLARARRARPASGPVALLVGGTERGVAVSTDTVAGDGARLDVTLYRPDGPTEPGSVGRPLVVYFHGGGWAVGNVASAGWLCSGVAVGTGALVVSVGYRMAPEHRFPTAVLDCHGAVADLVAAAHRLGVDAARVALMGDSAGGNLAAVVSLLAREGGPAVAGQALIYPATDATLASPSIQRLKDAPILDLDDIRGYRSLYLGPDGDPTDPRVSPLLAASHAGLPPTLVQTAEHDPIVDDGRRYADALAAAGVPVRYTCYEGMPHGFMSFAGVAGAAAHQARAEIVAFLGAALTGRRTN